MYENINLSILLNCDFDKYFEGYERKWRAKITCSYGKNRTTGRHRLYKYLSFN